MWDAKHSLQTAGRRSQKKQGADALVAALLAGRTNLGRHTRVLRGGGGRGRGRQGNGTGRGRGNGSRPRRGGPTVVRARRRNQAPKHTNLKATGVIRTFRETLACLLRVSQ